MTVSSAFDRERIQRLFDCNWYLGENPDVAQAGQDPLEHYLDLGGWEMRNPNPLFDSEWYLDTNPDVVAERVNPLLHYVDRGAAKGRDPHPLFDSLSYCQVCGPPPPDLTPLEAYLTERRGPIAGVYPSVEALLALQQRFLDQVRVATIADRRAVAPPASWAVFLQCGRASLHPQWLTGAARPWHLIASFYDDSYLQPMAADMVIAQNFGTKFSAVYRLLENEPTFFSRYAYVLFLDDDIWVSEEAITRMFEIAASNDLKLAQAALTPGSAHTWATLLARSGSTPRMHNAVEIMMPLISREALSVGAFLFRHSISGWGLDFALGNVVHRAFGKNRIAVIDAVSFEHTKPIDLRQGAYYRMLREHHISPLVEERVIGLLYGATGPIQEL